MMSTSIEKKISCFSGGICIDSLWFFSGRKLGQYVDQELLKSLFQNRTPDLKHTLIQVHDQEGKQAKWKNSVKSQRPNRKKHTHTHTHTHIHTHTQKKTVRQGNRKQRRRESNPFYLHVQATPDHVYCRYCRPICRSI